MQTNVVPIQLSMGAYNALQQCDAHSYWEFNYTTNWIHPLYELPFTGGIPGTLRGRPDRRAAISLVPGSGPSGVQNDPVRYGDNPNTACCRRPRDPDQFDADDDAQREFRERFIPSGLANEIFLDVFERLASFEPGVTRFPQRLFDAYARGGRARRHQDRRRRHLRGRRATSTARRDGFADNARLFLPATQFNRFAVTREINDGLLAPRFAPSQKAWVLSGVLAPVSPAVPASEGRDGDDR